MNEEKITIGGGLIPEPPSEQRFSHTAVFGAIVKIPEFEFVIGGDLRIKNQDVVSNSDLCAAYASSTLSEAQENVELSPEYIFAKTKEIMGDWRDWGSTFDAVSKALVKKGAIEQEHSPFTLEKNGRDFVANWENWDSGFDRQALKHKKEAYFEADGPYDTFDNIRAVLWHYQNEKRLILTGCLWKNNWLYTENGKIDKNSGTGGFGHAFIIKGVKFFGSIPYLVAHLSNGTNIGDKGLFYFPREIVNEEFVYGAKIFRDMPPELTKEQIIEKSMYARKGIFGRVFFHINNYLTDILQ